MSKLSANPDIEKGKRLEQFLDTRFPGQSWLSRSQELRVNNSTVIGWRHGREISNYGIARLLELGCDIGWLLTGQAPEPTKEPGDAPGMDEKVALCLENATFIHQHLGEAQRYLLRGELSADAFLKLADSLVAEIESAIAARRKRHQSSDVEDHDVQGA